MTFIQRNIVTALKPWEQEYRDFRIEHDDPENPFLVEEWCITEGAANIFALVLANSTTTCKPSLYLHYSLRTKPLRVRYWVLDNYGEYKLRSRSFKEPKSALAFMKSLG